jgi:hypothetical protein
VNSIVERTQAFCRRFELRVPILLAPMAGACPASLSIAVANAGGLGACGVLLMQPDEIKIWARDVRAGSNGSFQLNNWIPDPPPARDSVHEARVREFLGHWGPTVAPEAGEAATPDFAAQCEAMLEADPRIISSIMGLYPEEFVAKMKARGIAWWATATTVAEARAAVAAGAVPHGTADEPMGAPAMEFQITTPTMRSPEDLLRIRRVREMTALIPLPGDPPAAPAPRRSAALPRPSSAPPRPPAATTPAARAYAAGAAQARADALAAIAVCRDFGRLDLLHQVVGLTPAAARQYVIDQMWSDAFDRARATPSWMPR